MSDLTGSQLLSSPEAQHALLAQAAHNMRHFLGQFTVPLIMVSRRDPRQINFGSGVLVSVDGDHFVLTAGHCVKDCREADVFFAISSKAHSFQPCLDVCYYESLPNGLDYGYFELAPSDASWVKALDKSFLSHWSLLAMDREALTQQNDFLIVTGYPKAFASIEQASREVDVTQYLLLTHLYHAENLIQSVEGDGDGRIFELVATPDDVKSMLFEHRALPDLGGLSGGGTWFVYFADSGEDGVQPICNLAAVHVASNSKAETPDEYRLRQVPVGYHLKLIAEKTSRPELKEFIERSWPILESWE